MHVDSQCWKTLSRGVMCWFCHVLGMHLKTTRSYSFPFPAHWLNYAPDLSTVTGVTVMASNSKSFESFEILWIENRRIGPSLSNQISTDDSNSLHYGSLWEREYLLTQLNTDLHITFKCVLQDNNIRFSPKFKIKLLKHHKVTTYHFYEEVRQQLQTNRIKECKFC